MAINPGYLSPIVSGAGQLFSTILNDQVQQETNQRNYDINRENNLMQQTIQANNLISQRNYDSPVEQMKRLDQAGVNPFTSNLLSSDVGISPDSFNPSSTQMQFSPFQMNFSDLVNSLNMLEQNKFTSSENQKNRSSTESIASDSNKNSSEIASADRTAAKENLEATLQNATEIQKEASQAALNQIHEQGKEARETAKVQGNEQRKTVDRQASQNIILEEEKYDNERKKMIHQASLNETFADNQSERDFVRAVRVEDAKRQLDAEYPTIGIANVKFTLTPYVRDKAIDLFQSLYDKGLSEYENLKRYYDYVNKPHKKYYDQDSKRQIDLLREQIKHVLEAGDDAVNDFVNWLLVSNKKGK